MRGWVESLYICYSIQHVIIKGDAGRKEFLSQQCHSDRMTWLTTSMLDSMGGGWYEY